MLRHDPAYAERARRISEMARDLVEVLRGEALESLGIRTERRLAFHCPCTLQHAQKLGGAVESVLTRLGFTLTADFLASLGFKPVATDKSAKLYPEASFPVICRALQKHIHDVATGTVRLAA